MAIRTKNSRQFLAPVISNFLFHSPEDPKAEQKEYVELKIEIREYLNDKKMRKIIAQILFDLQKDVGGATRERLFKLYRELELHHDSFEKLKSWRWETVAKGILELSQMEVDEAYHLIRKYINDRRGVVRKQAELATVSLRPKGIDYVLDTTKHAISEWQQLKLIEVLSKIKDYKPPQFRGWLLSQNKDVVLFALRLIKHYNQKGAESSIIELVKHKNDEVKMAAIHCIMDFHFQSAVGILKKVFWKSASGVKIEILNAIAVLGVTEDLAFLKKVEKKESSFILVGKAQSTINSISPESILPSKDIISIKEEQKESGAKPVNQKSKQKPKRSKSKKPKTIEVDSVEVFDEIEIPGKKKEIPTEIECIEVIDEVEVYEAKKDIPFETDFSPAFEINPIEEEFGGSIDELMGLVSSEKDHQKTEDLVEAYEGKSHPEKSNFINLMGDTADERELPLLEHIAENEVDSELRFQAFKTMKTIQTEREQLEDIAGQDEPITTNARESVFYALYHHTDDLDAKLILLEEIIEVGDKKDLAFLNDLLHDKEKTIVKAAKKAIEQIENRGGEITDKQENKSERMAISTATKAQDAISITDEKLSLELFALNEHMALEPETKEQEATNPFDFEISDSFFLELKDQTTLHG